MAEKWYYVRIRGKVLGPFDLAQMKQEVRHGRVNRFHELSNDNIDWRPGSTFTEIFATNVQIAKPAPEAKTSQSAGPGAETRKAADLPTAISQIDDWSYVDDDKSVIGPMSRQKLEALFRNGTISDRTLIYSSSIGKWMPLGSVPELADSSGVASGPGGTISGFAISSLILGVLCIGGFGSVPAIILGIFALREISRSPNKIRGRALALAGITSGVVGLVISGAVLCGIVLYTLNRRPEIHTPEAIAREYRNRVYRINSGKSVGSGILIANNYTRGLIATNLHVIDPDLQKDIVNKKFLKELDKNYHAQVKSPAQLNEVEAVVAAAHRDFDLALLIVEVRNLEPNAVSIVRQTGVRDGEPAVAIGYAVDAHLSTTPGSISNSRAESGKIWTNCPINRGNSGGPLFLQRDALLAGLNTESFENAQNIYGSVPAEQIVSDIRDGKIDNWVWSPEHRHDVLGLIETIHLEE